MRNPQEFEVFEISDRNPYLGEFRASLEKLERNLWERLEEVDSFAAETKHALLLRPLEQACLSQHAGNITIGRFVLQRRLPREWVVSNIASVAETILADPDQEWVFRRLLELYATLDLGLLGELVSRARKHANPEVRRAAQDFRAQEPRA